MPTFNGKSSQVIRQALGTLLDKAVERQHNDEEAAGENTNGRRVTSSTLSEERHRGTRVRFAD